MSPPAEPDPRRFRREGTGSPPGRVEEPTTLLTNLVLAGFAGYWAAALLSDGAGRGDAGTATLLWGAAFAATALAAALGGVVHGFQHRMGPRFARPLWRATLHSVTLASAGMLVAAVLVFPAGPIPAAGLTAVAAKLGAATVLVARTPEFRTALVDHAIALAAVLALQGEASMAYDAASAPWIIAGVVVLAAAGAIQASGLALHPRFNHNDLYHVAQIGALWLLYRGGLLLVAG